MPNQRYKSEKSKNDFKILNFEKKMKLRLESSLRMQRNSVVKFISNQENSVLEYYFYIVIFDLIL